MRMPSPLRVCRGAQAKRVAVEARASPRTGLLVAAAPLGEVVERGEKVEPRLPVRWELGDVLENFESLLVAAR